MLNPETAKKLMTDVPECRELVSFLAEEALKLKHIDEIKLEDPIQATIDMKARKYAYKTLLEILDPLVNIQENTAGGINAKDFIV